MSFQISTTLSGRAHLHLPLFTGKKKRKRNLLTLIGLLGHSKVSLGFFIPVGNKLKQISAEPPVTKPFTVGF